MSAEAVFNAGIFIFSSIKQLINVHLISLFYPLQIH